MWRRPRRGFAQGADAPDGGLRRYILDLSERMGMTAAELGIRMSAAELMERRALDDVRAIEQEKAFERRR